MSNTYLHAKNRNDPRPITLSKVALLESGFSAVAILGGGWLQSPASDGPPCCLCSPIEQVKFKQNQNFRLIDNLVLQATCQIVRLSKRTTTCLRTFLPYNFGFHVVTVNMPRYAQLVMGPAGSGKVSFLWVSNYRPKRAWGFCFHFVAGFVVVARVLLLSDGVTLRDSDRFWRGSLSKYTTTPDRLVHLSTGSGHAKLVNA